MKVNNSTVSFHNQIALSVKDPDVAIFFNNVYNDDYSIFIEQHEQGASIYLLSTASNKNSNWIFYSKMFPITSGLIFSNKDVDNIISTSYGINGILKKIKVPPVYKDAIDELGKFINTKDINLYLESFVQLEIEDDVQETNDYIYVSNISLLFRTSYLYCSYNENEEVNGFMITTKEI
jgi:hypothetical protein